MTGSPFSNVLSQQTSDTTTETGDRPADRDTESSAGVQGQAPGATHVAGQDETPGDSASGTYTAGS